METINLNAILDREDLINDFKSKITNFEQNKDSLNIKRGFYIYGNAGSGKSMLINNILKELNYDIINYNASDVRNKSIIETITKHDTIGCNIVYTEENFRNNIRHTKYNKGNYELTHATDVIFRC